MRILGIIPARMASSRFPGKPMALIHGMPMIGHCYLRSKLCKLLTECCVATPDKEIYDYISSIDGKAIMTSHKHIMCNDRVIEAVNYIENKNQFKYDIIVNIQGDLPMIFPDMIVELTKPLILDNRVNCVTMADRVMNLEEFNDPNRAKVIFDLNNDIIFLTREPVPSIKKGKTDFDKFKHVAIRAYRRNIFSKIEKLKKMTPLEEIEGIDELRLIENNIKMRVVFTKRITETVDTIDDLQKVIKMMEKDPLINNYIIKS